MQVFKSMTVVNFLAITFLFSTSVFADETKIEWSSKDIVESRMLNYKYESGPEYTNKKDGSNYGDRKIKRLPGPVRLMDRVLKRDATLNGNLKGAPVEAKTGKAWLEDNYGRILDSVEINGPKFEFKLNASRAMHTGIYLKASLSSEEKTLWNGSEGIRMIPSEKDPWREYILGVYHMGTKDGTGELWRELGLSHRAIQTNASPAFPLQNDLKYHSSNILYSVLGLYHRDYKRWNELKAARKLPEAKGPVYLERYVCLSDPKSEEFMDTILTASAQRFKPYPPIHYSIGDEVGIGNMAAPHDLCGSKWCKPRYQKWLAERYKTIDGLNKQWDTKYKSWSEVEMFSNFQALEREATANYSPWADRLEFMDVVLYSFIKKGVEIIRKVDPEAVCNISGYQQPSCWGFDHWLLTQTVDCVTPYEMGESPDMLASFYGDGKRGKIYAPGFGKDMEKLWLSFLRGYAVSAAWDGDGKSYSTLIDIEKNVLKPYGLLMKKFADWVNEGPGRLRNRSVRKRDPVAILNSQPSNRGNWILELANRSDVHNSGNGWVNRDSWSVAQREMMFRVRVSWVMWTHDVGIWPNFVDTRDLGDNFLIKNGYKVLIIPRAVALSEKNAADIKAFAEAGGTVIADTWCGIMDETCRMRPKGVLDDFFGVTRGDHRKLNLTRLSPEETGISIEGHKLPFMPLEKTLKAADGKAQASFQDSDVYITKKVGKGNAVYLNFRMESYFLHRLNGERVSTAKTFLLDLMAKAGVKPVFSITSPEDKKPFHAVGHDLTVFENGGGYLIGVRPNPTVMHSDVGGIENRFEKDKGNVYVKTHPAILNAPEKLWAYDITVGEALGETTGVKFNSVPDSGRFYAFWPFSIESLKAEASVNANRFLEIKGNIITSNPIEDELLVVSLKVYRPDGTEQSAYRYNIDCDKGSFSHKIPLAKDEAGEWKIVLREPCSGKTTEVKVVIK